MNYDLQHIDKTEPKPTWILDDNKNDNASIVLKNVTSVWYDAVEENEKKMREEVEAKIGDVESLPDKKTKEPGSSLNVVYGVKDFNFDFHAGQCYGVIGSVGSGKVSFIQFVEVCHFHNFQSSLLLTALAEARMTQGDLELRGSVAYCSQEPWIFSGTIQENIVLGSDFDRSRYEHAIESCLLKADLNQFPNGDMTVVGDNGSTLSGGQRARISLARAVYSDADIYLLDDPLSAVDTQVGRKLYEKWVISSQITSIFFTQFDPWFPVWQVGHFGHTSNPLDQWLENSSPDQKQFSS